MESVGTSPNIIRLKCLINQFEFEFKSCTSWLSGSAKSARTISLSSHYKNFSNFLLDMVAPHPSVSIVDCHLSEHYVTKGSSEGLTLHVHCQWRS